MQQNVQSERPMEQGDYSQKRNSIPSKIPESDKVQIHNQTPFVDHNHEDLHKPHLNKQSPSQQEQKFNEVNKQTKIEKESLQKQRQQKQGQGKQEQNPLNKSFLSLSPHHFQIKPVLHSENYQDQLLQTKTQADLSFLESRKNHATKELQTEEQKYRENIRKLQLRKNQIKKKLKEDPEIPIKIMDFKDLERKKQPLENQHEQDVKQVKQNQHQKISIQDVHKEKFVHQLKSENQDSNILKSHSKKQQQQKQAMQQVQTFQHPLFIETQSKIKETQNLLETPAIEQSKIIKQSRLIGENESSKKNESLINKSKFTQNSHKKQSIVDEQNRHESKSRVSGVTQSNKRYSVKKSSVIVPEFNESIKEIQQRKERKSMKSEKPVESVKKSVIEVNQEQKEDINQEKIESSQKQRSRVSSVKHSEKQLIQSQKQSNEGIQQQNKSIKDQESVKQSNKSKIGNEKQPSQHKSFIIQKQQSIRSEAIIEAATQQKRQTDSIKQKSVTVKSRSSSSNKKQEKIDLMYIPRINAAKQPSVKSFKKSDKSIQWSEVDMSMYRTNNQIPSSHKNSRFVSQSNQQQQLNNFLVENIENSRLSKQMEINKINMKKNKTKDYNDNTFFEEDSIPQIDKKSQKSVNLVPILSNKKDKTQRESIHSKASKSNNNQGFFAGSREGSVKEKVERYDQFHRQHSLNSKKVESRKIAMIQNLNSNAPNSKAASYRSRKSNPISNSNLSKSQNVSKYEPMPSEKLSPNQAMNKNKPSELSESKVLISKEQINLLHSQINKLEEKLLKIEQTQQKLAKQRQLELVKLQQIVVQEEKQSDQILKNSQIVSQKQEQKDHLNIQAENLLVALLLPEHQSVSKQLTNADVPSFNETTQPKEPQNEQNEQKKQTIHLEQAKQVASMQVEQLLQQLPIKENNLQKSFLSQKQTIQHQIKQITEIEAKFTHEKSQLLDQITRLKKVIRDLQIEKIKSIDQEKVISVNQKKENEDSKSKRPETETNEFGFILHQPNKKNQTLDPIFIGNDEQSSIVQIGKIVKNNHQSPEKNSSRLTQNLDLKINSVDRNFRINLSKKSSIMSENMIGKQFDSSELSPLRRNLVANQSNVIEQGDNVLERKKKDVYPINAKDGYVVVSSNENQRVERQNDHNQGAEQNFILEKKQQQEEEMKLAQLEQSKIRKIQVTQNDILEKFHKTNRQFNNFIESSRIINETNSSISSQNNLFFEKTAQSGTFSNKKANISPRQNHNLEEEYNPENSKLLNKLSSSNLDINVSSPKQEFKESFTRIVDSIKNEQNDNNESDEQIPSIEVKDLLTPQLSKTPDITLDQNQLMDVAKETFKIFDIEVNYEDADFSMKKYKNCVIFTKGTETILWHYNGKFYIGGWKGKQDGSGEKTGYGIEIVPEKHIYKGQFMNGKKHGTGIMKTTNGNIYDGQWIEGVKHGQGIYYDATTKVVYQGQWKDGKKNGFGILKFSQKQYYKGTFVKSVKDGYGTEVFINGDKYKGQYRKGKFHGKGKYTWVNTSVFEGDFYEGMRHGNGCWKSSKVNGDIYVGTYQNDKKSGYGRYVWANGCIYEGNFAEDVKHGKGRLIYTDGKQIKGVWQQGSLLQAVTQNPRQHNQQQILKRGTKIRVK